MALIREWLNGPKRVAALAIACVIGLAAGALLSTPWVLNLGDKEATARYAVIAEVEDGTVPSALVESATARRGFAMLDYVRSEAFLRELEIAADNRLSIADLEEQVSSSFAGSILVMGFVAPDDLTVDALVERTSELILARAEAPLEASSQVVSTQMGVVSISKPIPPTLSIPALARNAVIGLVVGAAAVFGFFGVQHLRSPLIARQSDLEAATGSPVIGELGGDPAQLDAALFSLSSALGPVIVIHDSPHNEETVEQLRGFCRSAQSSGKRRIVISAIPDYSGDSSSKGRGLADVLRGSATLQDAIRRGADGHDFVPWGSGSVRTETFSIDMRRVLDAARSEYEEVLVVAPPLDGSRGSLPTLARGDANLVVVTAGRERKGAVRVMESRLASRSMPLDGVLLAGGDEDGGTDVIARRFPTIARWSLEASTREPK